MTWDFERLQSNSSDFFFCEHRLAIFGAAASLNIRTALPYPVARIVQVCTQIQMVWIPTVAMAYAFVKHIESFRNLADKGSVREPVNHFVYVSVANFAV